MGSIIKNVFFLATLGVILWFGYTLFFTDNTSVLSESARSEAVLAESEFFNQLKELRDLKLDTTIFSSEDFLSLTDRRVEVIEEEAGRSNPFARVPGLITTEEAPTAR